MTMKKFLLPLLALMLIGLPLRAQYFSYGAKLGLSFPGFRNEIIASERITPALSVSGNINISNSFALQLEASYELKGNKFTYNAWDNAGNLIEDSTYIERTNMGYVTVPLFLRLNLGRSNKFYGQLGGYYGYLLHSNYSGKVNNELVSKMPNRAGLDPHDVGILLGGGLETPVRRGLSMLLDVKYSLGMKDLNLDPALSGHQGVLRTRNFLMSMGFVIDVE